MLGGDESAFAAFGERYFRACYRYTLRLLGGDREPTRDLVQTAMTKALSKLSSYRGEASLFTWLCACCRNEVLMWFRSRSSSPETLELDGVETEPELILAAGYRATPPPGPEAGLMRAEEGHQVHLALDLLPPRYARALEWKYVERLPVREVAARLEVTAKAAESLLSRARDAFRTAFLEVQDAAVAPAADLQAPEPLPGSPR